MKTVIEMAREAGLFCNELHCSPPIITWKGDEGNLERFAELVRADEREACAKVCDAMEEKAEGTECCKWPTPIDCAHAIRARGNT